MAEKFFVERLKTPGDITASLTTGTCYSTVGASVTAVLCPDVSIVIDARKCSIAVRRRTRWNQCAQEIHVYLNYLADREGDISFSAKA